MTSSGVLALLLAVALSGVLPGCTLRERDRAVGAAGGAGSPPVGSPRMALRTPPPLPPVPATIIRSGPRDRRRVALTFDACSTGAPGRFDAKVTEALVRESVPATLFLGGKWMEDNPDHTRQLASIPYFELGNHAFLHPHMTRLSDERIRQEIERTQAVLFTLTGRQARLFRPPFGEVDERIARIAGELGLRTVDYDLASGDPDLHFTREVLVKYVTGRVRPGSIVVMHINTRGWHTAEAIPEIVAGLRARGFELVTVSELLGLTRSSQAR